MAKTTHPKGSAAALRRFGFVMAGAFAIIGGIMLWRSRVAGPYVLGVSGLFALLALLAPKGLGPVEKVWLLVGKYMGMINSFIILTVVYFVVLTPMALILRIVGKDLLARKLHRGQSTTYWNAVEPPAADSIDTPY